VAQSAEEALSSWSVYQTFDEVEGSTEAGSNGKTTTKILKDAPRARLPMVLDF